MRENVRVSFRQWKIFKARTNWRRYCLYQWENSSVEFVEKICGICAICGCFFGMSIFTESNNAVSFAIKVVPRARKNEIAGIEGDAVKIRLNAPPVEGKANAALIAFLAEWLAIRRAQVEIVTGETARRKVVRVRGVPARQIEEKIKLV